MATQPKRWGSSLDLRGILRDIMAGKIRAEDLLSKIYPIRVRLKNLDGRGILGGSYSKLDVILEQLGDSANQEKPKELKETAMKATKTLDSIETEIGIGASLQWE